MKKILVILLSVILSVTFSCCGLDDEPTKEINSTSPDSQMTENNVTFGLNETAVFTNLKFTATEIKESREEGVFEPKNGNVFVGIKFTDEHLYEYNQCRLFANGKYDILHGQDETALCSLVQGGAEGCICGTTNYNGRVQNEILNAWKNGDLKKANEMQNYSQEVINIIQILLNILSVGF